MKKQIVIATGLAVLSTSAYATKARMDALGQDSDQGSFYIQDTRNIFRNAAHVNTFKNYVATEWGTSNNDDDSTTAPHAEGGFFREMGSFAYGVYFGNEAGANNDRRDGGSLGYAGAVTVGAGNFVYHDNALDLFFGGDMGVQWGARLHYASNNNEVSGSPKAEQSALGLGLGIVMGDLEASANLGLSDESKEGAAAGAKFDNTGMDVNLSYGLGDMTVFAGYDADTIKYVSGTGAAEVKSERTTLEAGVAKTHEVSSTARVTAALSYKNVKSTDTPATGTATEVTTNQLPLWLTYEAEANSWLTLRGSVGQAVIVNTEETKTATTDKKTQPNQTAVNAGATLSFGKLKVDGSIGTTTAGRLNLDTVMTRVGVHYWF